MTIGFYQFRQAHHSSWGPVGEDVVDFIDLKFISFEVVNNKNTSS